MKISADHGGCYPWFNNLCYPQRLKSSEICRILYILRKPNSIIALLFIQNISPFLKEFHYFALFFRSPKIIRFRPHALAQRFNKLQRTDVILTSSV